jgi:hypothetical protein
VTAIFALYTFQKIGLNGFKTFTVWMTNAIDEIQWMITQIDIIK